MLLPRHGKLKGIKGKCWYFSTWVFFSITRMITGAFRPFPCTDTALQIKGQAMQDYTKYKQESLMELPVTILVSFRAFHVLFQQLPCPPNFANIMLS